MTLNKIEQLLGNQEFPTILKKTDKIRDTINILSQLGVKENSEFMKLYSKYFLRALDTKSGIPEIIDPMPPQGFSATYFQEVWGIPKNYILFTSGEGEGGYLYNTEDNTVWDFNLGQQQELLNGTLAHWDSFYEFMEWYLTIEEED